MSCPWLPGRPQYTPEVKELVRFGLGVTGFTVTDNFAKSGRPDYARLLLRGGQPWILPECVPGLQQPPEPSLGALHNIAVSSLSKLRSNLDEFKKSWASALSLVSFFSALAFATLAVCGQDFIVILFGPKWAPAGPLLCLFAVRGIAQSVERTLGWLHVPAGRSDRWMRWGFFSAICQFAAVAAGLPFGAIGVATAHAIATFCLFVPAVVYAGEPLGIGAKDVLRAVETTTAAALIAVAIGITLQSAFLSDLPRLAEIHHLRTNLPDCIPFRSGRGCLQGDCPMRLAFSLLRDLSPTRSRRSP